MQRSLVRPSPIFFAIIGAAFLGGVLASFGDVASILSTSKDPLLVAGVFILVIAGWAASLTLHEFGHAIVAYRGGDREVAIKGYLSMDIRRYTDPALSLLLPLLLLAVGGIPLPGGAVWINRGALRSRATSTWVSLAGPLSNLAIGVVLTLIVVLLPGMPPGLMIGFSYLATLQILAFVLNILPIPGLDGFGAIEPYLSPQARELGAKVRPWAPLILFALIIGIPGVSQALWDGTYALFEAVGGNSIVSYFGQQAFMFWR